jgi:hypothetical protein
MNPGASTDDMRIQPYTWLQAPNKNIDDEALGVSKVPRSVGGRIAEVLAAENIDLELDGGFLHQSYMSAMQVLPSCLVGAELSTQQIILCLTDVPTLSQHITS